MSASPVIVVGAGGHALVVADALLASGRALIGFIDNDPARHATRPLGLPVLGGDAALAGHDRSGVELANGIGGTGSPAAGAEGSLRQRVQRRLEAEGWQFTTVCHPAAVVAASATLGAGAQVLAGAIVQPQACIGAGAIVNTRAVVEHDGRVGAFAHIAPGAVLCGDVEVGEGCHVGAGAVVRNGLRLGPGVVVGIGAAVTRSFATGVLAGVPARLLGQTR